MPDGIRWVGLDVHARESTFAIFDQDSGEVITKWVVGRPHELLPWLRAVERPARMVYEAGPCPASDREFPVASRDLMGGHRRGVDTQAPLLGDLDQVRQSRVPVDTR